MVEFLRHQGEKLIRSGPEYRLASDHSITIQVPMSLRLRLWAWRGTPFPSLPTKTAL